MSFFFFFFGGSLNVCIQPFQPSLMPKELKLLFTVNLSLHGILLYEQLKGKVTLYILLWESQKDFVPSVSPACRQRGLSCKCRMLHVLRS